MQPFMKSFKQEEKESTGLGRELNLDPLEWQPTVLTHPC